ncbi:phage portal protein [Terrihalobacillus insolitus]|uniref:phage portal protein n=1 Tax=Terrihalobacillus insolitus TaxID=2950438 RepID=UPI0023415015|nr:phage portal protein [Terrihalobacillus insolitus]MDC3414275.1 phage portal protein [Terrihalobacillus insolitus]
MNQTLSSPSQWMTGLLGGSGTIAGKRVTEESAMNYTAVYAAQKVISETIASLPLPVYQRLEGGGKERAPNHYLYSVLHDQANSEMTAFTFKELMQHHILSWGNAWAEIEFDRAGRVRGLWPLNPANTWMERNEKTKKLEVITILPDGQGVRLPRGRVFHIPGLGDGLMGKSPIRMHQEAIGLGQAVEEFGARFFGNGANPGGIVEYPGRMSDEAYERFKKDIREKHSGLGKSHRIMVLEEGLKYQQTGIPPEEAQFLETRKFQLGEVARIYRVPPHMIGDLDRSTNNNIEQQSIEFVVYTMRPWLVRWEQAIKMQLISTEQKKKYFAEFLVDGLLRGDIQSRYEAYAIARQNGWLSANDIRDLENQNPLPEGQGGGEYLVNGTMIPIAKALEGGEE